MPLLHPLATAGTQSGLASCFKVRCIATGPLHLRTYALALLVFGIALFSGACGRNRSSGSIPTKTVTQTETYTMPSSSMEPTIHCARPGAGCEASVADRVVVQEPEREVK